MTVAVLLVESLVLVWLAKLLWGRTLGRNMTHELTTNDNPAAGITVAGYFLGIFIALAGVAAGPAHDLLADALAYASFGMAGVVVLFASLFVAPWVGGIKLRRDIAEGRNVAAGIVLFATFIATGLIFGGAVRGDGLGLQAWLSLLVFQLLGQLVLGLMAHFFEFITPFDLHAEIVERQNLAAAAGYGGALVAMGLLLHNAVIGDFVNWQADLTGFAIWCTPLLLLWPVRSVVVNGVLLGFSNLNHEIAVDRNVGVGVIEAATYVGFALLVMNVA